MTKSLIGRSQKEMKEMAEADEENNLETADWEAGQLAEDEYLQTQDGDYNKKIELDWGDDDDVEDDGDEEDYDDEDDAVDDDYVSDYSEIEGQNLVKALSAAKKSLSTKRKNRGKKGKGIISEEDAHKVLSDGHLQSVADVIYDPSSELTKIAKRAEIERLRDENLRYSEQTAWRSQNNLATACLNAREIERQRLKAIKDAEIRKKQERDAALAAEEEGWQRRDENEYLVTVRARNEQKVCAALTEQGAIPSSIKDKFRRFRRALGSCVRHCACEENHDHNQEATKKAPLDSNRFQFCHHCDPKGAKDREEIKEFMIRNLYVKASAPELAAGSAEISETFRKKNTTAELRAIAEKMLKRRSQTQLAGGKIETIYHNVPAENKPGIPCEHEGCNQEIAPGNKKFCKKHSTSRINN